MNDKLSQTLVTLGLSINEDLVYQTLLREGNLSAKEIGKRVGLLTPAIYRLLASLVDKELVASTGEYPRIYHLVSPSIALDLFTKKKIAKLQELRAKAVAELISSSTKDDSTRMVFIKSQYEMMMTYAQMAKEATKEILIVSIGEPIPEEVLLANIDAIKRGVSIKMIVHKFDKNNEGLLNSWKKMGLKIRYFLDSGFHIVVIDGKESLISVSNPKNAKERLSIKIFNEGLSGAFSDYFSSTWEKAKEI